MEPALQATTNLLTLASATGQTVSQAESAALYAELLERLNRLRAGPVPAGGG